MRRLLALASLLIATALVSCQPASANVTCPQLGSDFFMDNGKCLGVGQGLTSDGTSIKLTPASASILGGILSSTAPAHQFANGISTGGAVQYAQPAAGDISGLAASATTDATNATNITSGTLNSARLPTSAIFTAGVGSGANASLSAFSTTWTDEVEVDQNAQTLMGVVNNNTGASAAAAFKFITGTANSNATFKLTDNAAPTFGLTLGSALPFWTSPPIKSSGSAPTCSSTGSGTGPSCSVSTGSNSQAGKILITAGTTPGNSGTFTITLATALGSNVPACVFQLNDGGANWNARASLHDTTTSASSLTGNWDNNAVNLTATSVYHIGYVCFGK